MNFREGTRRLALLLGGLGAIVGAIGSYSYLQPVMHQRELHRAFEQLATSDIVKQERKKLQAFPDFIPDMPDFIPDSGQFAPISGLPPSAVLKPIPQHGRAKLSDAQSRYVQLPNGSYLEWPEGVSAEEFKAKAGKLMGTSPTPSNAKPLQTHIKEYSPQQLQDQVDWGTSIPPFSKVNEGGIETINWGHDYGVESIEATDGQTLYPTAAPSAWLYLLIALLPLLGFLIPWSVIRAVGWVGAGFVASAK
jgi:hypothetical protein